MSGGWPISQELSNNQTVNYSTSTSFVGTLTITTSSVNVKNAYTQLVSATTGDITWLEVVISGASPPINSTLYTDVAIGGAGSEVVLLSNLTFGPGTTTSNCGIKIAAPIAIPSGTRVAARFALSSSTTTTTSQAPSIGLQGYDSGFPGPTGFAGMEAVGQTNGIGTVILTTTSANVKTAYVQLTASTGRDYAGFFLGTDGAVTAANQPTFLVDLAVGAGGSEKNILNTYLLRGNVTAPISCSNLIMIPIPSGTRISARAQSNQASSSYNLTLYGLYE